MRKAAKERLKNIVGRTLRNLKSVRAVRPLKTSDIYFPDRIPTDVPDAFPKFINGSLRIAVLLSDEMYNNLKYECLLIDMKKANINKVLKKKQLPNFLLVESCNLDHKNLKKIIQVFGSKSVQAVLWVTAPLDSIMEYKDILPLFTLVFSADCGNIDALQKLARHNNIFYLPFGVQPRLYNPVDDIEKDIFAAYIPRKVLYGKGFTAYDSSFLSDAARCYNAEVIDFNNLPHSFKKYYVVLVDDIQKHSTCDVYPLLYQLLACGVIVIAAFDSGLQETFADNILFAKSYDEALYLLGKLYKDSDYRDRHSLLGQRFIFSGNTYTHRIEAMLGKLGYHKLKVSKPGVSIVCCTHMDSFMNNIFENYQRQAYDKKELIIVLNDPDMNKSAWDEKAQQFPNVRVMQPVRRISVGYCVNLAVENAYYEYIANFDHDDYYGPEYISDSINAFKYTDAGLVGKKTHFVYYEESKTIDLMLPGYENKYVVNIDGSSIVFKKAIFSKVRFINSLFADIQFSLDCWNNGIKIYSCDKYNHVYIRAASKENHAFKFSDADLKKMTYNIDKEIDDYKPFSIV